MEQESNNHIKELLASFLRALHIEGDIIFTPLTERKTLIAIHTQENQGYLIGRQGATLEALQHFVNVLARKETPGMQYRLDINNYQEERNQAFLKRVAEYIQEKEESTEILLWPMSPYERRLVHEYFLAQGTHSTESEDFGSKRVIRVVKK